MTDDRSSLVEDLAALASALILTHSGAAALATGRDLVRARDVARALATACEAEILGTSHDSAPVSVDAPEGLRPTVVHGLLGDIGVHHGHDLVIVQGANAAHPDRYLWVGEPDAARQLAAALVDRADHAAVAQRRAEQATARPCGARGWADVGPTPTTGCTRRAGHDDEHSWEDDDLEDAAARKPPPDSSWVRTTEAGHGG